MKGIIAKPGIFGKRRDRAFGDSAFDIAVSSSRNIEYGMWMQFKYLNLVRVLLEPMPCSILTLEIKSMVLLPGHTISVSQGRSHISRSC